MLIRYASRYICIPYVIQHAETGFISFPYNNAEFFLSYIILCSKDATYSMLSKDAIENKKKTHQLMHIYNLYKDTFEKGCLQNQDTRSAI